MAGLIHALSTGSGRFCFRRHATPQNRGDKAKILAGRHGLVPILQQRPASPGVLTDVGWIAELARMRDAGNEISIGADDT